MQLTEPDRIYGTDEWKNGKRKIGWAQAIYPLRARLQELKTINLLPEKWDDALEDDLIEIKSRNQKNRNQQFMELKYGEQAFMSTRPRLIQAGYTRWCDGCLLITKRSKAPSHYRYLIWVLGYIPYMRLAGFSFAITRVPVYTAISNFWSSCSQRFEVEVALNSTSYFFLIRGRMAHGFE